jgi:hypothetical protein
MPRVLLIADIVRRYTKLVKLIDFDEEFVTILNATTDR